MRLCPSYQAFAVMGWAIYVFSGGHYFKHIVDSMPPIMAL